MIDSFSNKFIALTIAIAFCLAIHLPAWADEAPQGNVVHLVVMWFKDGGTAAQRQQLIEVTRSFKDIPGVLDVRVGETLQEGGGPIDNSFSVSMYIVLEDEAALQAFSNHPIHLAAKQSGLLDGLERMVVYNFTDK
jgi:hypothetical protein